MNTTQRPQSPNQPQNPYATYASPSGPRAAYAYPQPATPWWERDGVVGKILAGAGVLVTLVGVVMLLVIAAKAGLLRPEIRVGGGALLSAGLIAAATALSRRPGGRIGAVALSATGAGGLFLCDVAATIGYDWIAPGAGLAVAGFIGAAVVALAMRWNSQPLAALMIGCVGVLAPAFTRGEVTPALVGFLTLLLVVGCVPEFTKEWPAIAVARTLPAAVAALVFVAFEPADYWAQINAYLVATVALCTALVASNRRTEAITAVTYLAANAAMIFGITQLQPYVAAVAGAAVAVVTMVSLVVARPVGPATSAMGTVVSGFALLVAAVTVTTGDWLPVMLLVIAVAFMAALHTVRNHFYLGLSAVFGVAGIARLLGVRGLFDSSYGQSVTVATAVAAVLATAWVALAAYVLIRRYQLDADLAMVFTPAALMGTTYLTWTATAVAAQGAAGFNTAHLLVTVSWMIIGLVMLALSLRVETAMGSAVTTGLVIVAVSIGKLFLNDLAALSGMVRAGGFLVIGLLLLAAGAAYAPQLTKRMAQRRAQQDRA
ncbi:DUF2339 domain-containing protein [Calidifontibacter terrae]